MKFITPLRAEDLPNGKRKLINDLKYVHEFIPLKVPTGFETDGTSMPWFMRWWVSPWQVPYSRASVLHDYYYKTGIFTRKEADFRFYLALNSDMNQYMQARTPVGTIYGWFKARTRRFYCYTTTKLLLMGVRLFGWYAWNQHRESK